MKPDSDEDVLGPVLRPVTPEDRTNWVPPSASPEPAAPPTIWVFLKTDGSMKVHLNGCCPSREQLVDSGLNYPGDLYRYDEPRDEHGHHPVTRFTFYVGRSGKARLRKVEPTRWPEAKEDVEEPTITYTGPSDVSHQWYRTYAGPLRIKV